MEPCVKLLGADFELANAIERSGSNTGHVSKAARLLLREIPGYPKRKSWSGTTLEWGRKFLPTNGGSAYIDSDHLEINLPEHTSAEEHVQHVFAGFKIAGEAQCAASKKLSAGSRINVSASVSDRHESWGSHLNVLVCRRLFQSMFFRKPHLTGVFATHLATSTIFTGQGKVGARKGSPHSEFQLSQRADWFEQLAGWQTTHHRPLLNTRDEPHAAKDYARMHIIFFDRSLSPTAIELMAGTTQLVLAMAEAGQLGGELALDDPLSATHLVSRDLSLRQPLPMAAHGKSMSAVEVQRALADRAGELLGRDSVLERCVPGAPRLIRLWHETLDLIERRDLSALARRCDWALKYLSLDRFRKRRGLPWNSDELKMMDLQYANLDHQEGLFWQMARCGLVDNIPSDTQVTRYCNEPPSDTRAYFRTHLLRKFGDDVVSMNWDQVQLRSKTSRGKWSTTTFELPEPLEHNSTTCRELLRHDSLLELIEDVEQAYPGSVKTDRHYPCANPFTRYFDIRYSSPRFSS